MPLCGELFNGIGGAVCPVCMWPHEAQDGKVRMGIVWEGTMVSNWEIQWDLVD